MKINKVVTSQGTLIDLTGDTVAAQYVKNGVTTHLPNGETVAGTASIIYNAETKELFVPSWALEVE